MTTTETAKTFGALFKEKLSQVPPHLLKEKEAFFRGFEERGVPTRKDELWKYTSLSLLKDRAFKNPTADALKGLNIADSLGLPANQTLVLESGKLTWSGLNYDWGPGVQVLSRQEVVASPLYPPLAKAENNFSQPKDGMDFLNEAMAVDGFVVHVYPDTFVKDPIYVVHITGEPNTAIATKNLIAVENSAELTICEIFVSANTEQKTAPLHQSRLNIVASNNARVHYFRLQNEMPGVAHVTSTEVLLHRDAQFDGVEISLGSQVARHNLKVCCLEPGSQVRLWGGWISSDTQVIDHHTDIEHVSGNTQSRQFYKGILANKSRSVFNGRIHIHPKAQLSNSELLNKNLVLHTTAEIDTKPELEIFANDVKASHGATVGQLDPQQLFYLESRGIPKVTALHMLTSGYLEEILNEKALEMDARSSETRVSVEPFLNLAKTAIAGKLRSISQADAASTQGQASADRAASAEADTTKVGAQ